MPEGWVDAALPNAFVLNPPKPKAVDYPDDATVTFVPMSAVDAESGAIRNPVTRKFADVRKGFTAFRDDDVILAKITPCMENGKAAVARNLLNGIGFGSTEFHVFRSTGAVLPDYLFHFLRQETFRKSAEAEMTGSVGQKRVPAEFLLGVTLPIPPLDEQRRIVAAVERLLERVASARGRLERVPTTLKRFRQAVITAACSGRLTAEWRTTHAASPDEVRCWVEAIHQSRQATPEGKKLAKLGPPLIEESPGGDPSGWAISRVGDVSECLDHLRVPIKKENRGEGGTIPYYGANGRTGWITKHLFDEELVLVVEDETFVGRELPFSYVIKGKTWVNNHAHVLRPLGGMSAEYLNILLARYDFVPLTSGTTGRRKLNQAALLTAPIALAPIAEQAEIVRCVSALFALADSIEQRAKSALRPVQLLTQSILARAFRGELVPTEAELARREGRTYEPADELLIRLASSNGEMKRSRGKRVSRRATASGEELSELLE
jgi:type I restriction enzyme S subunit